MRLRLDGGTYRGRAVDLRGYVASPAAALDALEGDSAGAGPLATVTPETPPLATALAAAARSRGHDHPADEARRQLRSELSRAEAAVADAEDATAALTAARRRAAEAGDNVERLRERVATLRGRLQATRGGQAHASDAETSAAADADHSRDADADADVDADGRRRGGSEKELESTFASATRALTEAETERAAAEQALARARRRARAERDARQRRLRLRDALANRRREARAALARAVYPAFADALAAVPGDADPGAEPAEFAGDPVAGQLAAVRLAERAEPVVVAVDRFDGVAEATRRLNAPVVLVGGGRDGA
ncbi:hypothetical protein BRC97_07930 [Halobacteriales archaeon QS_6_71_20]|nr:MAG: hypothetical protein BRC97_07930 [Halobacteriales archaeon QS_6_71_20]